MRYAIYVFHCNIFSELPAKYKVSPINPILFQHDYKVMRMNGSACSFVYDNIVPTLAATHFDCERGKPTKFRCDSRGESY